MNKLPSVPFSFDTLNKLILKSINEIDKVDADINASKDYLKAYIYITYDGNYLVWNCKDFDIYGLKTLRETYLSRLHPTLSKWFLTKHCELYRINCDTHKPRIYSEDGSNYINLYQGLATVPREYSSYGEEDKKKVGIILEYIKTVLSSNSVSQSDYLMKWLSNMVRGNKNTSALYIIGNQGIGKSSLLEILYLIVGKSSIKANLDTLVSPYNSALHSKLLVVYEEIPTINSQYHMVVSKLKDAITSDRAIYSEKYIKSFESTNINNYIVTSNNRPLDSQGRRWHCMDVDNCHVGNTAYWDTLYSVINKRYAEVFHSYLLTIDVKNFNPQADMPLTRNKLDTILEKLPSTYLFVKNEYILKNKPMTRLKVGDLYSHYVQWATDIKKVLSKTLFIRALQECKINYYKSNACNLFNYTHAELVSIASKLKWLHELDEYDEEEHPGDKKTDHENHKIDMDELKKTNLEQTRIIDLQNEQIAKLMRRLAKLEACESESTTVEEVAIEEVAIEEVAVEEVAVETPVKEKKMKKKLKAKKTVIKPTSEEERDAIEMQIFQEQSNSILTMLN